MTVDMKKEFPLAIQSLPNTLVLILMYLFYLFHSLLFAQLRPAQIFGDHMVLQRDMEVPIWGMARPGENITVVLDGNIKSTLADTEGHWYLKLPRMQAGGPYQMKVLSRNEEIIMDDVLIGEVWFASGQSNMEHAIGGWSWIPHSEVKDYGKEIKDSDYPNIRMFNVPKLATPVEFNDLNDGAWVLPSASSLSHFSATAWFFAKELHNKLNVPIGIIHSSWGGTAIAPWMDLESLGSFHHDIPLSKVPLNFDEHDWRSKMNKEWSKHVAHRTQISFSGLDQAVALSDTIARNPLWKEIPQITALGDTLKNWVWLKKELDLPQMDTKGDWYIQLGYLNRQAHIFINGTEIGYTLYPQKCIIHFSPRVLQEGKNVILIRLAQPWGEPKVEGEQFTLVNDDTKTKLEISKNWLLLSPNDSVLPNGTTNSEKATYLFNGMVAPLARYAIKGFIWNQGGSDINRPDFYKNAFPALIKGWRKRWEQPEAPFIFVQLSNYQRNWQQDQKSVSRAPLRLAQMSALTLPHTAMVVSYDIGNPLDVHPANKQDFGYRLAIQALSKVYGFDIQSDGPRYKTHVTKGNVLVVHLDNGPIHYMEDSSGGCVGGFEIAGVDGVYFPARASFQKNHVHLTSDKVPSPKYVRYAWSDNPECIVYNSAGLPLTPFITDN